jgi:hypothetical protein
MNLKRIAIGIVLILLIAVITGWCVFQMSSPKANLKIVDDLNGIKTLRYDVDWTSNCLYDLKIIKVDDRHIDAIVLLSKPSADGSIPLPVIPGLKNSIIVEYTIQYDRLISACVNTSTITLTL